MHWGGETFNTTSHHHHHHHHHISVMELGHLLTRSGLTYPEVSSFKENLCGFFPCDLPVVKISPNGLRAQSRVSPVVGLLPLASGPACLGMAFSPFLMKQLHRCESVVISLFVRMGYTTRRWGWLLGRLSLPLIPPYTKLISKSIFKLYWISLYI